MPINRYDALFNKVQKLCLQRGVRLTAQRLSVLKLIAKQSNALSAYDLLNLLQKNIPNAKPPTIYRALEFLLAQGFIHKIESTNSYVLCHRFGQVNHLCALFICDLCHAVTEHEALPIASQLDLIAQKNKFYTQHSIIEVHGYCQACQSVMEKENAITN